MTGREVRHALGEACRARSGQMWERATPFLLYVETLGAHPTTLQLARLRRVTEDVERAFAVDLGQPVLGGACPGDRT